MNNLAITGTIFPHKDIHKNTWTSPDGKTHNQIDHILVNQQFRRSILEMRVRRGADVASDHHLVQTRVRLKLKKITKPTSSRIRYDVDKLRHEAVRKKFTLELRNRLAVLEAAEEDDHDINSKWTQFNKAYNNTAEKVLGRKRKSGKSEWLNSLMDDAQHAADMGKMETLYGITKTICNECPYKNPAIK